MSILYTPFTQTKTFFNMSYIFFDHTTLVTRYSVVYPCTDLTICDKKQNLCEYNEKTFEKIETN